MSKDKYTATDESIWHLSPDCPPIPTRAYDWSATHDEYDGAPDADDNRVVYGETREIAIAAVEAWLADQADEAKNADDKGQTWEEYDRWDTHDDNWA